VPRGRGVALLRRGVPRGEGRGGERHGVVPKSVFEGLGQGGAADPAGAPVSGQEDAGTGFGRDAETPVFQPCAGADFTLQVQLEQGPLDVYVIKRPGVDEFLQRMAAHYEIVVFTASVQEYANPLLDILDKKGLVAHRLFRDSCTSARCGYVKDLSSLGRPSGDTIIG